MRILTVSGVVCIALAMAGCDTDQPLDASSVGGAGNTVVTINASARVASFRVWDWTEDANGNGMLDLEFDLDHDGRLDTGEDVNRNGVLDPGEDRNANGQLNGDEDFNSNGLLDRFPGSTGPGTCPDCEDMNVNCILDPGEDRNNDGLLYTEDIDCDGRVDVPNEDRNQNGVRDLEDTIIANSSLDAGLWCEGSVVDPTTGLLIPEAFIEGVVPVPLSGEVLLYHQGNPTPEVVASVANSSGLTPYDGRVLGTVGDKNVSVGAIQLPLTNGQVLPAGSPRLASAVLAVSPEHWTAPDNSSPTNAPLCIVNPGLGQPNLELPLPIPVAAAPGDTVSVRLLSKQLGTFILVPSTNVNVGATVSKNGAGLPARGTASAPLGQAVSFHVAVP